MRSSADTCVRFDEYFRLAFCIAESGSAERFFSPSDVAESPTGELYVTDELEHKVRRFSSSGRFVSSFGSEGAEAGQFRYPTSLSFSEKGHLSVTDRWNHRVQVFSHDGGFLSSFGSYGVGQGCFNEPWGCTIVGDGNLLVVDRGNHRVQVFSVEGEFISSFGRTGLDSSYYESAGFKSGFVFEKWRNRVSRFRPIETSFRDAGYEFGSLEFPRWIAPYRDDNLLITDASGAVHVVNSEGAFTGRIVVDCRGDEGPFTVTSVAATPSGTLLVCDECRSEIVAVKPGNSEQIILGELPHPVSHLRVLPSGRLALLHGWDNEVSIWLPRRDI